jgi:hypothetical protein
LEQNQNVLIWSAYYWNKIGTFQSVPKLLKIKLVRFSLLQAAQESKQNVSIFKKLYQNETKTLQIAPGFFKYKKNI